MILLAFLASGVAVFCAGFIARGWVEAERQRVRRVPNHPTIRRPPRQLRVIEGGGPYDQDNSDKWRAE